MSFNNDILDAIPPLAVVRDRLSEGLRAVRLLRSQLRLAEQAEEARQQRAATSQHAQQTPEGVHAIFTP